MVSLALLTWGQKWIIELSNPFFAIQFCFYILHFIMILHFTIAFMISTFGYSGLRCDSPTAMLLSTFCIPFRNHKLYSSSEFQIECCPKGSFVLLFHGRGSRLPRLIKASKWNSESWLDIASTIKKEVWE